MGAWDSGPFDNDHAADWVLTVVGHHNVDEIADALDVVAGSEDEPAGIQACCYAVAAAEVVSAARGYACPSFPKELKAWMCEHAIYVDRKLTSSAKLAVRNVLAGSELGELWDDNPGWKRRMNNLIKRLSQPSKVKRPRAKRAAPAASGSDDRKALIQKLRRVSDNLLVTKAGVIEEIDLSSGRASADDLKVVLKIPTLLWLAIYYDGLGDSELEQISKHPRLEELRIDDNPDITDDGLKHLANLSTLKKLHISYCDVTDVGLNHLTKLSGLKSVWAYKTGFTKKGITKFRKSLPGCSVKMELYRGVD